MLSRKRAAGRFLPALFILLAVLISACGGGTGSSSAGTKLSDDKQIFVYPQRGVSDVATLDPGLSTDSVSTQAIQMLFTGLVQLDDNLKVKPQLATSYSVAADGVTWTFKLRQGAKFSDGNPITADDVVYSIDRALKPELKSTVAPSYLALIKDSDKRNTGKVPTLIGDSLFAPDPTTVKIVTSQKAQYFLDALTYSTSYVVEKSFVEKYGDQKWTAHLSEGGASGPFKLEKHISGQLISFVPNTNYYNAQPQLKKVVFPFYKDSQTVYKAYKSNQVDLSGVPGPNLDEARAMPGKQYHQSPILAIYYYGMNYLTKPFNNIKIRQAFALAINRDTLAHSIYKDRVVPSNHIVPQGMPGYNQNLTGPAGVSSTKGDKTLAKKLFQEGMQEEGYTASTFPQISLTVATSGSPAAKNEFQYVQQQWKDALGVNVIINDEDFNKLLDDEAQTVGSAKGLQLWSAGWVADYPDPQDWTTLLFGKGSSNNQVNYGLGNNKNVAAQRANQDAMVKADTVVDQASRMAQYNQIEQKLINDVAWAPTYQSAVSYVLKPCVKGWVDNAQSITPPDDWANIYKTTDSSCANTNAYK